MANYDYITQAIIASTLIEVKDIDSFYQPIIMNHTGYAWDGTLYSQGVRVASGSPPAPTYASWFTEGQGDYRGDLLTFPQVGLVLLSPANLTILDGSNLSLTLWMQFLLDDDFALTNNFNSVLNGFTPSGLIYADGVLSVTYVPDAGNSFGLSLSPPTYNITSNMTVNLDFCQDKVYLDVAI